MRSLRLPLAAMVCSSLFSFLLPSGVNAGGLEALLVMDAAIPSGRRAGTAVEAEAVYVAEFDAPINSVSKPQLRTHFLLPPKMSGEETGGESMREARDGGGGTRVCCLLVEGVCVCGIACMVSVPQQPPTRLRYCPP